MSAAGARIPHVVFGGRATEWIAVREEARRGIALTMGCREVQHRLPRTVFDGGGHRETVRPGAPRRAVVGTDPQRIRPRTALIAQLRKLRRRDDVILVGAQRHTVQHEMSAAGALIPHVVFGGRATEWIAVREEARRGIALTMDCREV